jgi:hypothetical protein
MNISNAAEFEWGVNVPHRPGQARTKRLINRPGSGTLKGLKVGVSRVLGEKTTPRHHHNFDQLRIGLAGVLNFGSHQKLVARSIMYVPAGTWYGPETWHGPDHEEATLAAIFQFVGDCKIGMLNTVEIDAATDELKKRGEFRDGFYWPNEPGERRAIDAYEASYELASGAKVVYPPAFVNEPIYMNVDARSWVPSPERGVEVKMLGAWGNYGLRLGMSKIARGLDHALFNTRQRLVAFCLSGEASVNGKAFVEHSALLLEPGETAIATGVSDATEFIEVALPNFD